MLTWKNSTVHNANGQCKTNGKRVKEWKSCVRSSEIAVNYQPRLIVIHSDDAKQKITFDLIE